MCSRHLRSHRIETAAKWVVVRWVEKRKDAADACKVKQSLCFSYFLFCVNNKRNWWINFVPHVTANGHTLFTFASPKSDNICPQRRLNGVALLSDIFIQSTIHNSGVRFDSFWAYLCWLFVQSKRINGIVFVPLTHIYSVGLFARLHARFMYWLALLTVITIHVMLDGAWRLVLAVR